MAKQGQKKNRYNKNSTKRRLTLRPIRHPFRLAAIGLGVVAVIVTAVIWGNVLYAKSEAYRNDKAAGRWNVTDATPDTDALPIATDVPDIQGAPLSPGGSVRSLRNKGYTAATLWLCDGEQTMPYQSDVAMEAGIPCGERSLKNEIARLHENGLQAVGVFTVHTFDTLEGEDAPSAALSHYRMQTELAILEEYAAAGLDELLLIQLPLTHADAQNYVIQLKQHIGQAAPLIGVVCPTSLLLDEMGSTLPAEYLQICDYLALDMADMPPILPDTESETADEPAFTSDVSRFLYRCRYPYVRYRLRLIFDGTQTDGLAQARSHGFERFLITASNEE